MAISPMRSMSEPETPKQLKKERKKVYKKGQEVRKMSQNQDSHMTYSGKSMLSMLSNARRPSI